MTLNVMTFQQDRTKWAGLLAGFDYTHANLRPMPV